MNSERERERERKQMNKLIDKIKSAMKKGTYILACVVTSALICGRKHKCADSLYGFSIGIENRLMS